MTPRATAHQAVEILKIYQLRRENAAIYELVQRLQLDVSDLQYTNKSIRDEIAQAKVFNNLASNHRDQIDKLTSEVSSLTHKSNRLAASFVENKNGNAKQHDETQRALVKLGSRIEELKTKVGSWDKKCNELHAGVAEQITVLQEKFVQNVNTSHTCPTEDKLRQLENDFATLPVEPYNINLSSRVSDSVIDFGTNNVGSATSQMMTSCQQTLDETVSAFVSIPTQLLVSAAVSTNGDHGGHFASAPRNHTILSTQSDDIDLDEAPDDTGYADSNSMHMTIQDPPMTIPLQLVQGDQLISQATTSRQCLGAPNTPRTQEECGILPAQWKIVNTPTSDRPGHGIACEKEQHQSGGQLDPTSFIEQTLKPAIASWDVEKMSVHKFQSGQVKDTVISNTKAVTKSPIVVNVRSNPAKQAETPAAEKMVGKQIGKKRSNVYAGVPIRRSQRLMEKSRGQTRCNTIRPTRTGIQTEASKVQSAETDASKKTSLQPKTTKKAPKQPDKPRANDRADGPVIFPRTPEVQIIRQDLSGRIPVDQMAMPASPLRRKLAQEQTNGELAEFNSRTKDSERPAPSPYDPQPRLLPRKRKVILPNSGWTSDLDVCLPPLKRQATLKAKTNKQQGFVSKSPEKRQKRSLAPSAILPILSTSTEEDRRFERW